ncbi:unnamed protein product [Calypogeia fissa]
MMVGTPWELPDIGSSNSQPVDGPCGIGAGPIRVCGGYITTKVAFTTEINPIVFAVIGMFLHSVPLALWLIIWLSGREGETRPPQLNDFSTACASWSNWVGIPLRSRVFQGSKCDVLGSTRNLAT